MDKSEVSLLRDPQKLNTDRQRTTANNIGYAAGLRVHIRCCLLTRSQVIPANVPGSNQQLNESPAAKGSREYVALPGY